MAESVTLGGFFGLESPDPCVEGESVLTRWTGAAGSVGFHNARSGFAWLVRSLEPATVWLPSYLCADMDVPTSARLRRYRVDASLFLDDPAFEEALAPGDMVVAVAYFGAPVCERLRRLARRRDDVTWVEDRAQALALDDADAVAAAWWLYSPRKLMGVGDGGLVVGPVDQLAAPDLADPPSSHLAAAEARAEATTRLAVEAAYRLFVGIERDHAVADLSMAEDTLDRLRRTAWAPMAWRRRENFATLDGLLRDHAAPLAARLRGMPAPFGYPLWLPERRDAVAAQLAADGFFCAVHWRELGGGPADPIASALRDGLLTLPLDHRYGTDDMERLAGAVLRALA